MQASLNVEIVLGMVFSLSSPLSTLVAVMFSPACLLGASRVLVSNMPVHSCTYYQPLVFIY